MRGAGGGKIDLTPWTASKLVLTGCPDRDSTYFGGLLSTDPHMCLTLSVAGPTGPPRQETVGSTNSAHDRPGPARPGQRSLTGTGSDPPAPRRAALPQASCGVSRAVAARCWAPARAVAPRPENLGEEKIFAPEAMATSGCVTRYTTTRSSTVDNPRVNANPFTSPTATRSSTTAEISDTASADRIVRLARSHPRGTAERKLRPSRTSSLSRSK